MGVTSDGDTALVDALGSSQRLGMLGARPITEVIEHAEAFVAALPHDVQLVIDLGSGGGVPGLVVAWRRPAARIVLVDRRATRTDQLQRLVGRLDLTSRVTVLTMDAAAVSAELGSAGADAVVARGFGPPLVTAAAAAPLLRPAGRLVVSEPPEGSTTSRWPSDALAELGLESAAHQPDPRVRVLVRST